MRIALVGAAAFLALGFGSGPPRVALKLVASGLEAPLAIVQTPDGRLLVAEQSGRVRVIDTHGRLLAKPFLDLRSRLVRLHVDYDEVASRSATIYASGFRNPYRFSFDAGGTHELIVGDVGEDSREEVDVVQAGGNYGWPICEGTLCGSGTSSALTGPCSTIRTPSGAR